MLTTEQLKDAINAAKEGAGSEADQTGAETAGKAGSNKDTAKDAGKETKTFTQDEVNQIVSDRLKREKERVSKMLDDDEGIRQELVSAKLRLKAVNELTAEGYPISLIEYADLSNEDGYPDQIAKVKKMYDSIYKDAIGRVFRENGRTPEKGGHVINADPRDKMRGAFGLR